MTQTRQTRRNVLTLISAGIVGSLSSIGAVSAREEPYEVQQRSVTKATAKYQHLRKALAQGFEVMGPYVPDMGWHAVNFDRIEKAAHRGINIRKPQALTYNLGWQLGSVEYIVPLDDESPDIFNDDGEDLRLSEADGWHPHHGAQHIFANGNGRQDDRDDVSLSSIQDPVNWIELSDENPAFPGEQPGLEPGDEIKADFDHDGDTETRIVDFLIEHDDWWTLHAWFHFDNPEGVFAPFNHNTKWDPLSAPAHH